MRFSTFFEHLSRIVLAVSIVMVPGRIDSLPSMQADEKEPARLDRFDMLTGGSGWVLLDRSLFWTSDGGSSWEEIGPSVQSTGSIQAVMFLDADVGWVLWTTANADGSSAFYLAQTVDRGESWTTRSLSLFEPGDIAAFAQQAEMGWFDEQTGWISVKQNSGSNFSVGTLFTTTDGGRTWHRSTLPGADKIYFSEPHTAWAVGGPSGDRIYRSRDGGQSWIDVRPSDMAVDGPYLVYPPFVDRGQGLLAATQAGIENKFKVYTLENSSGEWLPAAEVHLGLQPGRIGLSILDEQNLVAAIPGTTSIVHLQEGALHLYENADGLSASIVALDMVSREVGWAKSIESSCATDTSPDPEAGPVSCSFTTRLLRTEDGGVHWQVVELPIVFSEAMTLAAEPLGDPASTGSITATGNTELFIGQGFDRCEIPTLSQMQTWSQSSPYRTVNLYIGGSSRACDNNALISSYLFQLYRQGWKFIPTWVGPQAPCTGYNSRMSSDVATAYQQGVAQANLAVERLAALGLTGPAKTGSVVYYDIEHYGNGAACRSAVNAFMNGWVSQIRSRGSLAGVYGSTLCDTGLSDFLNITHVPDVIWPARWYHNLGSGFYNPNASVWDLGSCIPNTVWSDHQRIRQYEGDHNETWGGLTLDIDSDVLDGVVAFPYDYTFVNTITRANANPSNAASVGFNVSFSKPVTGVDPGDFSLNTSGVNSASISSVSGSGAAYLVTVNTGSGDGSIRLDLVDNDSIRDAGNTPLGGTGSGNGNYRYGASYTIVKSTFVDVPSTHLFWREIEAFYQAGITTGCNQIPKMYCPLANVTRGEMAVFLERAMGNFAPTPDPSGMFDDVPYPGQPASFQAFIEEFYNDGITTGCSRDPLKYCPQNYVTRGEMAVFIERALGNFAPTPNPTGMFDDVPYPGQPATFTPFIEQFYNDGITTGCSRNPLRYCPQNRVTRQEMAVFIVRAFGIPLP